jgi:hypothetical protein
MNYPQILMARQNIHAPKITNIPKGVRDSLSKHDLKQKVKTGQRVVITAGSRGVRDIVTVIREIALFIKSLGALPFVSPAMGSHGGATAEGQREVLASLGITEETVGAPIISSMETEDIGKNSFGTPVLIGRDFTQADHVIVLNRIKPHTDFRGSIESGLYKIMMIGMGKHAGAKLAHRLIITHGFERVVVDVGKIILNCIPVLLGIGIVENHYDETAIIKSYNPDDILFGERRLLTDARQLMARIPFDNVDVLIVDEMGKTISGTGMDTNVIGRIYHQATPEPTSQKFRRIYVRDLTEDTHGNALGVGLADYVSTRLASKIDFRKMRINCVTGTTPEKGRLPLSYDRDDEAIEDAIGNAGVLDGQSARLVWIKNTLELEYLWVSDALWRDSKEKTHLEIVAQLQPLPFDLSGNLPFGVFEKTHLSQR